MKLLKTLLVMAVSVSTGLMLLWLSGDDLERSVTLSFTVFTSLGMGICISGMLGLLRGDK